MSSDSLNWRDIGEKSSMKRSPWTQRIMRREKYRYHPYPRQANRTRRRKSTTMFEDINHADITDAQAKLKSLVHIFTKVCDRWVRQPDIFNVALLRIRASSTRPEIVMRLFWVKKLLSLYLQEEKDILLTFRKAGLETSMDILWTESLSSFDCYEYLRACYKRCMYCERETPFEMHSVCNKHKHTVALAPDINWRPFDTTLGPMKSSQDSESSYEEKGLDEYCALPKDPMSEPFLNNSMESDVVDDLANDLLKNLSVEPRTNEQEMAGNDQEMAGTGQAKETAK